MLDIANGIERSVRLGNIKDIPEGQRYIQISDTLAKEITEKLRIIAQKGLKNALSKYEETETY